MASFLSRFQLIWYYLQIPRILYNHDVAGLPSRSLLWHWDVGKMADILRKIPFTEELLPAVQNFHCGDEPWETPLAAWIQAGPEVKNGALYELRKKGNRLAVWLHVNESGDLIG